MWPTMLNPQGPQSPSLLSMSSVKKQQHRHLMMSRTIPINRDKSFKNPNFVNSDFDKCKPKSLDSFVCSKPNHVIIESIKEMCPTVIPNLEVPETLNEQSEENSAHPNHHKHMLKQKSKDCKTKQKKKLRQNLLLEEINSRMPEESPSDLSDISLQALEISFSPKPVNHTLGDFIKPNSAPASPSQKHHMDSLQMLVTIKTSPHSPPLRRCSVSDSEDSFILFSDPEHASSPNHSPCRTRRPSYCDSEDSFIVFDRGEEGDVADDSSYIEDSDSDESEDLEDGCDSDDEDEVDFCHEKNGKKVTFASTEKLCQVHPMIKWSFAYKAARKGPWETYAFDRLRFRDRGLRIERDIKHVFDPQHRDRIYRQRFQNL